MASKKMTELSVKSTVNTTDYIPLAASGSSTLQKTTVAKIGEKAAEAAESKVSDAVTAANTAAANANSVYEKVKDADFSTYATAITNTISVTGATTSPQAKKVTNLTFTTPPETWSAGFLMGNRETNEVTLAGYGNFESTETSMDYVSQDSSLFGIVSGSNVVKLKRFRLTRLFNGIDFGALTTSAKTIIGAINELKTSLASNVAYVDATLDNISINSGNVVFKDFTMSKDGYTCIGVIMVQLGNGSTNGSGSSGCICTGFYPTSTGVHVNIRNQGSNTAIIKVTARGLFVKN